MVIYLLLFVVYTRAFSVNKTEEDLALGIFKDLKKEFESYNLTGKSAKTMTPKEIDSHTHVVQHKEVAHRGFHTIKIHGNVSLEYYFINAYFGTPPQKQSLIIDSGSDFTAFPCNTCDGQHCGVHENPWFNLKNTSTAHQMKCHEQFLNYKCNICNSEGNCVFSRTYSEDRLNSLSGNIYTDFVTIGDREVSATSTVKKKMLKPQKLAFGCTLNEPALFKTQKANGIMGLKENSNTETQFPNILDIYYNSHQDFDRSFSLCFGENGGVLTLGGYNVDRHVKDSKIQTIPYVGQYVINVDSILLGDSKGERLTLSSYEFIFDSGTTYIWLPSTVFRTLRDSMAHSCKNNEGNCLGYTYPETLISGCIMHREDSGISFDKVMSSLPPLTFMLGEKPNIAVYTLLPQEYILKYPTAQKGQSRLCSSFRDGGYSSLLLGNQFMRHYDIHFNRDRRELSFIRSQCDEKFTLDKVEGEKGFKWDDKRLQPTPRLLRYMSGGVNFNE